MTARYRSVRAVLAGERDEELDDADGDVAGERPCSWGQAGAPGARLEVAPGTDDGLVRLLREMAEWLCVNLDTLLHGVPVMVSSQHPSVTGWPHRVRLLAHRPNRPRL